MPDFKQKLLNRATMAADDPSRKREPRNRSGNAPDPTQRPQLLMELHNAGTIWRLAWLRANKADGKENNGPDSDWYNLKLYAVGKALHKANYWLSWHAGDKRLKSWLDARALATVNPQLHKLLIGALTDLWQEHYMPEQCILSVARWEGAAITVEHDPMHIALLGYESKKQHVFTAADIPRLQHMITLVRADDPKAGPWRRVPDELTGGFTLRAVEKMT